MYCVAASCPVGRSNIRGSPDGGNGLGRKMFQPFHHFGAKYTVSNPALFVGAERAHDADDVLAGKRPAIL